MNQNDKNECLSRYNERFSKLGFTPEALGWSGGKEKQEMRFRAALGIEKCIDKKLSSILDFGCGFGDFGDYLRRTRPEISYVGVDINPQLIEEGRKRYQVALYNSEDLDRLIPNYDVAVINGVFNYRLQFESHEQFIYTTLESLLAKCKYGVAADFLSEFVEFSHPGAYHCTYKTITNIAHDLNARFVIRADYLKYEFMVYFLKGAK